MKALLFALPLILVAPAALAQDGEKLRAGKYILVRSGERIRIDPQIVTLSKEEDGRWRLQLQIEDVEATPEVQVIEKGEQEDKEVTEIALAAIITVPASSKPDGDGWRVSSYQFHTFTLHGEVRRTGRIEGVTVATWPSGPTRVGTFVMKAVEDQAAGAEEGGSATAEERK